MKTLKNTTGFFILKISSSFEIFKMLYKKQNYSDSVDYEIKVTCFTKNLIGMQIVNVIPDNIRNEYVTRKHYNFTKGF